MLALVPFCAVLGLSLTGCGFIQDVRKSSEDAWAVTYEISTDSATETPLSAVEYVDRDGRLEEPKTITIDDVAALPGTVGNSAGWAVDTIAVAGDDVSFSATPAADVSATCRILLDGEREIASFQGEPGEAVNCVATTPQFEQ